MMQDTRAVRDEIEHVRRLLAETTTADDLAARASEVRDRLRQALERVEDAARAARTETLEAAATARRSLDDELAEAAQKIRDNPLGAVALAAGIGLVLGLLIRRR
jgi:ElaB/YqjD/DUF883 family membrane-anchored ribosome-binding protein